MKVVALPLSYRYQEQTRLLPIILQVSVDESLHFSNHPLERYPSRQPHDDPDHCAEHAAGDATPAPQQRTGIAPSGDAEDQESGGDANGSLRMPTSVSAYLFFHPPRCPGAPPLDRGLGPNSGPDCRESVGWMIRLLPPKGLVGRAPPSR